MADVAPTVLFPDRQPDEPEETQTHGGMDMGEDASDLLCSRCGSVLNAENLSAGRGARHTKAVCKTCVAVWQTLHRNLAGLPEEWQGLSMEEQRAFFKKCSDLKKSGSGPLQYKAVKAVLVEHGRVQRKLRHYRGRRQLLPPGVLCQAWFGHWQDRATRPQGTASVPWGRLHGADQEREP